jgi:ethanolamine utilization cobalamin adenosyltransferase
MLHYWPSRQFGNAIWGLNRRRWDAREQLRIAIVTWIECTYHRRRRQATLCRLTPSNTRTS